MRLLRPTSDNRVSLRYSKEELASASRTIFIPVVGHEGAGKSSYIQRLLSNAFVEDYNPTLFDHYDLLYEVGGEVIRVVLLDTVHFEEYCSISPSAQCGHYKVDALLVLHEMHDTVLQPRHVDCKDYVFSLERLLNKWLIDAPQQPHFALYFLPTKSDLPGSREYSAEQLPWKFSDQRVISLAPVSAKTGEGVHESMLALLGLIMHTTSIDPRMLLFLLDLIAPVSPHFLSRLPSDLKLMILTEAGFFEGRSRYLLGLCRTVAANSTVLRRAVHGRRHVSFACRSVDGSVSFTIAPTVTESLVSAAAGSCVLS